MHVEGRCELSDVQIQDNIVAFLFVAQNVSHKSAMFGGQQRVRLLVLWMAF